MKLIYILILLIPGFSFAQSTSTGPLEVSMGETATYSFNRNTLVMYPSWSVQSTVTGISTLVESWQSGTTYYVKIRWNKKGSASVIFYEEEFTLSKQNIAVNDTPFTTFTLTENCGSVVVTRDAGPPAGYDWYWQTSDKGTSTSLGMASSITISAAGTTVRFLRARMKASPYSWSAGSRTTGEFTVYNTAPAVPSGSTNGSGFPGSTVTLAVNPSLNATSYRWYSAPSGGTRLYTTKTNTNQFPDLNASTDYYVAAASGGCETSSRRAVSVTLVPAPTIISSRTPPAILFGDPLSLSTASSYDSYQWTNASNLVVGTSRAIDVSQTGVFKVTVTRNGVAGSGVSTVVAVGNSNYAGQVGNYVVSQKLQFPLRDEARIGYVPIDSIAQTIQYFDGLGRPMQSVTTQGSPLRKDMVEIAAYDAYGREHRKYLPVVVNERSGWRKSGLINASGDFAGAASTFYQDNTAKIAMDAAPYSEKIFESAPMERPLKEFGPGMEWRTNNRFVGKDYLVNSSDEQVIAWEVNSSGMPVRAAQRHGYVDQNGFYVTGTLHVLQTTDENRNVVREYKDRAGLVVLKKVQVTPGSASALNDAASWAMTYFLYDMSGKLRYGFQPELSKKIHAATGVYQPTQTELIQNAFIYTYDARGRLIEKKVPGAGAVYYVYDSRDRVVLTQQSNQRTDTSGGITKREWSFTKYDQMNRPVMTGIYTADAVLSQAQMQDRVNTQSSAKLFEVFVGYSVQNMHGYTNSSFPWLADPNMCLTVTYYDSYNFKSGWSTIYDYMEEGIVDGRYATPSTASLRVVGQKTGGKVKVLDEAGITWLRSVTYFDERQRVIQNVMDNYKGGLDRVSELPDFTGKVLRTRSVHTESDPSWKDHASVNVYGAVLKSARASGNGVASVQMLNANQDGWIEFTFTSDAGTRYVGLNDANTDASPGNINYAFKLTSTGVFVVENDGLPKATLTSVLPGDVLRIERKSAVVKFYRNGIEIPLSSPATSSSSILMADISMSGTGSMITGVRSSFTQTTQIVNKRYVYDHAGRLLKTFHQFGDGPEIALAENELNELGQIVDKKLHRTGTSVPEQSVDYRYNIRGWIASMNNASLTAESLLNDDSNDYFGYQLHYNGLSEFTTEPVFNGNISAMRWSNPSGSTVEKQKGYSYMYDAANRLTGAQFRTKGTSAWTTSAKMFSERNYTYDLNGNITGLTRYDQRGTQPIDSLAYTYSSDAPNQLVKVTDAAGDMRGFSDGANEVREYIYDSNGSIVADRNRGVTSVAYNHLNLPVTVTRGGNSVHYIYAGNGSKLTQVVDFAGRQQQTDYVGIFIYENDLLQYAVHDEGRVVVSAPELVFSNKCEKTDAITWTGVNATTGTINGEKYIKVVASSAVAPAGITSFGPAIRVSPGQRYRVRMKGYRDKGGAGASSPVLLSIRGNTAVTGWGGSVLPEGASSESWVEQVIIVPAAVSQITIGVNWTAVPFTNEVFFVNEVEVINETLQAGEYQYQMKDHLGNVRLTFTTKTDKAVATMENHNAAKETAQFLYLEEAVKVNSPLFDHTYDGTTGPTYYATRLTGGSTNAVYGLAKSLKVFKGDTIRAEVFTKYVDPVRANWTTALNSLLSSIASGTAAAGTYIDGGAAGSIGGASYPVGTIDHTSETTGAPKAYLNYLVFNADMSTVVKSGFVRVSEVGREFGQNAAHERLSATIPVTEEGYVYIYLSNENPTMVEVYFDDFRVDHKVGVIQSTDYYPFGLAFNSYLRDNTVAGSHLYAGKELQDELGLGWIDYGARMYQPEIGRWNGVDAMSEVMFGLSPYNYAGNTPVNAVDKDGNLFIFANGFMLSHYMAGMNTHTYTTYGAVLQNQNHQPYRPDRGFSPNNPRNNNQPFEYWDNVDLFYSYVFKDWNRYYTNGSFTPHSSGAERYIAGVQAGRELIRMLDNGDIELERGETIKIVGHSQGAAYAAGIASELARHEKYGCLLEFVDYLAPHQPGEFKHPSQVKGRQFSNENDRISSNAGVLGKVINIFNGGSHLTIIDGVTEYRVRRHRGGRGGHDVSTWISYLINYYKSYGIHVELYE